MTKGRKKSAAARGARRSTGSSSSSLPQTPGRPVPQESESITGASSSPPPHMKEGESENDTLDARAHSSVNVPVKALATPTRAMVAMVVRRVMVESIILFPLAGVKSKNGGTTE